MKKVIIVAFLLFGLNSFSQQKKLIDYFFSSEYSEKEFKWNIGVSELQMLKKDRELIASAIKRYLPNGSEITLVEYYQPYNNKIVHTVQKTSLTNQFKRIDETVMQYPDSDWEILSDKYKSTFTSTKTDYNEYIDCIAVSKHSNDFGLNTVTKYYAYGIGLVKEVAFDSKDKLVYSKQLVDKRTPPSDESVTIERKLDSLRKNTYSFSEQHPELFDEFVKKYTDEVILRLKRLPQMQLNTRGSYWKYAFKPTEKIDEQPTIKYERFYNRVYSDVSPSIKYLKDREINKLLRVAIKDDEFPLVCLSFLGENDCFKMSTIIDIENFRIALKKGVTIIKKSSKDKFRFFEKSLDENVKYKIEDLMKAHQKGKYLVSYYIGDVNNKDASEIAVEIMK
ncbi:hypothetical protein [Gelidibacter pelagius]|uniref:Uncharacterized protein n=1 Tax=Gelidibacter pelagius TaxID=2819985 RepID=A0ABS3SMF2_9FLAO|nr:hypothetical protein [Gelidibacter pelagius]MBO3096814.1 hypothetical protein [Gelidibacter pelagius]